MRKVQTVQIEMAVHIRMVALDSSGREVTYRECPEYGYKARASQLEIESYRGNLDDFMVLRLSRSMPRGHEAFFRGPGIELAAIWSQWTRPPEEEQDGPAEAD